MAQIEKAKGVVFTITGNSGMSLTEVNEVASVISDIVSDDANIIFGTSVDETYQDEISVTVVATSFDNPPTEAYVSNEREPIRIAGNQLPDESYADPYAQDVPDTRKSRFWGRF